MAVQVRELIYREILEYHPHMLADYLAGGRQTNFMYPSAVDSFRRQFAHLEGGNTGRQAGLGQVGSRFSTPCSSCSPASEVLVYSGPCQLP